MAKITEKEMMKAFKRSVKEWESKFGRMDFIAYAEAWEEFKDLCENKVELFQEWEEERRLAC